MFLQNAARTCVTIVYLLLLLRARSLTAFRTSPVSISYIRICLYTYMYIPCIYTPLYMDVYMDICGYTVYPF